MFSLSGVCDAGSFGKSQNYIASWIREMKNDAGYIWKASRDASKIADHFLKQAGIETEQKNETEE
jgi:antirestriction protein ArdC